MRAVPRTASRVGYRLLPPTALPKSTPLRDTLPPLAPRTPKSDQPCPTTPPCTVIAMGVSPACTRWRTARERVVEGGRATTVRDRWPRIRNEFPRNEVSRSLAWGPLISPWRRLMSTPPSSRCAAQGRAHCAMSHLWRCAHTPAPRPPAPRPVPLGDASGYQRHPRIVRRNAGHQV